MTLPAPVVTDVTAAVFEIVPLLSGAVTTMVIGGAAVTPRLGRVHVTVTPLRRHVQPVAVTLTNPTVAGSVSITVRLAASLGPAFATSIV